MTIFLYSKSNFIAEELKKEPSLSENLIIIDSFDNLVIELKNKTNCAVIHHIDDFKEDIEKISSLVKKSNLLFLMALSNSPDNLEGCSLLKMGYKSYLHSVSNYEILKSAIDSVLSGNMYVYPKLMQFLISNVSTPSEKNTKLDTLTPKELSVLEFLSKGLSNAKIASELGVAEITVKKHIGSLFEKLEVKDRLSLALILK